MEKLKGGVAGAYSGDDRATKIIELFVNVIKAERGPRGNGKKKRELPRCNVGSLFSRSSGGTSSNRNRENCTTILAAGFSAAGDTGLSSSQTEGEGLPPMSNQSSSPNSQPPSRPGSPTGSCDGSLAGGGDGSMDGSTEGSFGKHSVGSEEGVRAHRGFSGGASSVGGNDKMLDQVEAHLDMLLHLLAFDAWQASG